MPLTALFTPAARRTIADLLEDVFQTPATATLHLTSEGSMGRPALEARMVLFPLKSDLGDVSRILGCMVAKGEMGMAPRRFDIRDIEKARIGKDPRDLIPHESPKPPAPVEAAKPKMVGFADPKADFEAKAKTGQSTKKARPAYLRLIKSDE